MPTPRHNPERKLTPAEKQARHRQKKEAAEEGSGLLYQLERAVWEAADRGDVLAETVKAGSIEGMIERLAAHFEGMEKPQG